MTDEVPLTSEILHYNACRWASEPLVFVELNGRVIIGKAYGYDRPILDVVSKEDLADWIIKRWHARHTEVQDNIARRIAEQEERKKAWESAALDIDLSGLSDLEIEI